MALNAPTALSIAGRPNPLNERKRAVLSDVSTQIMDLANDPNPGTAPQSLRSAQEIGNSAIQAGVVPVSALPAINQFIQAVKNQRAKTLRGQEVERILAPQAITTPSRTVDLETIPNAQLDEQGRRRLDQFQVPAGTLRPGERVAGKVVTSQGNFAKAVIEKMAIQQADSKELTAIQIAELDEIVSPTALTEIIKRRQTTTGIPKGNPSEEKDLEIEAIRRGLKGEAKFDFKVEKRAEASGKRTEAQQAAKPVGSAIQTAIAALDSLDVTLKEIETNFDANFLGIIKGTEIAFEIRRRAGSSIGQPINTKELIFRQSIFDLSDKLLRARSGAQINEKEAKRLRKLLPKATDEGKVFLAGMIRFKNEITIIRRERKALATTAARDLVKSMRIPNSKGAVELP